jgi:hypothetical protein
VLSAQVLPQPLKELAISRLEAVEKRLWTFPNIEKHPILLGITQQQIKDNINYLRAKDQSHLWSKFIEFNHTLDHTRNVGSIASIVSEFQDYV